MRTDQRLVFWTTVLFALSAWTSAAWAQSPRDAPVPEHKLFMWKATRGADTVYLLGTIHTVSAKFFPMRPEIENAFSGSKHLVVEIKEDALNSDKVKNLLKSCSSYSAPDHLSKHLSPETKKTCDEYFAWAGEPMSLYEQMKPWMLSMTLSSAASRRQGFERTPGIDHYLLAKAKTGGKPVIELETAEEQVKLLDGFSEEAQDKMLRLNLLNLRNGSTDYQSIEQAWRSGDAPKLDRVVRKQFDAHAELAPVYDKLLSERNTRMAARIDQLAKHDGPYFVAVGAAHMAGDNGLVDLLEERGFDVEQVVEQKQSGSSSGTASATGTGFGARRLQRFHFSDGECSIGFPGKPTMSYSDQLGTRSVEYSYADINGVYLLQYSSTPAPISAAAIPAVYDRASASLCQGFKHGEYSQSAVIWPSGQARQIDFIRLPFKAEGVPPDSAARVRLFASGKHFYLIGAFGRRAWLDSAIVAEYMNGLSVSPTH